MNRLEEHAMDEKREDDPPEKKAAEGRGGEEEEVPQDETDNKFLDSEEHSDAPGPFGTG